MYIGKDVRLYVYEHDGFGARVDGKLSDKGCT